MQKSNMITNILIIISYIHTYRQFIKDIQVISPDFVMAHPYISMNQSGQIAQNLCNRGKQHKNMPIMMICLEQQCSHRRKCCLTCIDQLHRKHEIISVAKFKNYISQILSHNFMLTNRAQILKLIDHNLQQFKNKLHKLKSDILTKFDTIQTNVDSYFKTIMDSFVELNHQTKIKQFQEQFTDKKVDQLFKITKQTQKNLVQSITQIDTISKNTLKLLQGKCQATLKQFEKGSTLIEKVIQNFKITGSGKSNNKLQFNSLTKAGCLQISADKKTVVRSEGSGGYPIAVVSQPFTQINNEIKFRVTDQPQKKGVWLGVCVHSIVKNFEYKSCYGLNKGAWAIDQVGVNHTSAYSWSHHDSNFNSTPKVGWQFNVGDTVTIRVDFAKSIVCFERNQQKYEQPIQLNLGPIYAFAGPTNLGDTIEIV